jgi:hypothetical protein
MYSQYEVFFLQTESYQKASMIHVDNKFNMHVSDTAGDICRTTLGPTGKCTDVHQRPCSGFVEVMAPVFTKEAWTCVWHMIQNDLVHGWGLDWNFWRCADVKIIFSRTYLLRMTMTAFTYIYIYTHMQEPEQQIGVVDAQYVAHHFGFTLGNQRNATVDDNRGAVRYRASHEFGMFKFRLSKADEAQARALAAKAAADGPPRP